jgi:NADH dehydrogenase
VGDRATPPPCPTRRRSASSRVRRPASTRCARAGGSRATSRATLGNGKVRPFSYRTLGVFVDMGQGQAVAETVGLRWRGRVAWVLARSYHLAMMPGVEGASSACSSTGTSSSLFGRDLSELGQLGPPRVARRDAGRGRPRAGQETD